VEATADLYAITFDDCGVTTLDVLEVTDDLVFVDDGAFCKCCHCEAPLCCPSGVI